jgi:aspartyl protease family protein
MGVAERKRAAARHGRTARSGGAALPQRADGVAMKDSETGSRRLFWGLMIGLGLGLLILVARHDEETVAGLGLDAFSALVLKIALLVFLSGSVIALFRHRFTAALEALLFWLLIGLVLGAGYTYRHDLQQVADRAMAQLVPGRPAARAHGVEIARRRDGQFLIAIQINGAQVNTLFDTGASAVVLTQEDAKTAGLPLEVLAYSVAVDTANGRTRAAAVTLDRIVVGGIVERAVPALVAQPGGLRTSLLGMSFLNRLESFEVRGDRLVLRGYP